MRRTYVLILEVATNELVVSSLPAGQRPKADSRYRCHGPFRSKRAAERAVKERLTAVERTLYGNGRQFTE